MCGMDDRVAHKHYEAAAKLGDVDARVNLGIFLYTGRACKKNVELAVKAWQSAAKRHHPVACTELAKHYLRCQVKEEKKAKKKISNVIRSNHMKDVMSLLKSAADQNYTSAIELLQVLK